MRGVAGRRGEVGGLTGPDEDWADMAEVDTEVGLSMGMKVHGWYDSTRSKALLK